MKKTILYFLVVPFVMLILSLTCTKEEGADCHKRISTKMRQKHQYMLLMTLIMA